MLPPTIQSWVEAIQEPIPLRAIASSVYEGTIRDFVEQYPMIEGTATEALLWLRLGLIDRAHEIVQDASRGVPAYIHGIIHRMEGDYWNASYWFSRCHNLQVVTQSACEPDEQLSKFSATKFTTSVERFFERRPAGNADDPEAVRLARVALSEWAAVWEMATAG